MAFTRISHIWYFVDDLEEAERFWCEQLGFPLAGREEGENVTVEVGDVTVGLHLPYPGMEELPPSIRCAPTIEFTEPAADLVEDLREKGVRVLDPIEEEWGVYVQAFDPFDNSLGFWQPPAG